MHNKKRVGFLLVLTLFLLLLVPSVFALFESIYYTLVSPPDLATAYYNWQLWIDGAIFFLIFASIARIAYTRIYGKEGEEPPGATGLYLGIGLFASLGLVLLERQMGWSLLNFGPIILFVVILVFLVLIYQFISKNDKLAIGPAILFLLLALLLTSVLFPNLFGYVYGIPVLRDILGWIFMIGILVGIFALLIWLTNLFRGRTGGGGGNGAGGGGEGSGLGNAIGRRLGRMIEPGARRPEEPRAARLHVDIVFIPPQQPYNVGQRITLVARLRRRRFGWREADIARAHCTWNINGIVLDQHDTTINYDIPPDVLHNELERDVPVAVVVRDLDNPSVTAGRTETMRVRANLPELIITEPVDTRHTRDLRTNLGSTLPFSYIIAGAQPQGVADASWFAIQGRLGRNDLNNLRTANGFRQLTNTMNVVLIGQGNFQDVIGPGSRNQHLAAIQPGQYTIAAIAQDNQGNPYVIQFNQQLLVDHFFLEIQPGAAPPGQTEFFLNVLKQQGRQRQPHTRAGADFGFAASVDETYYFIPEVQQNGNNVTANYQVEITATNVRNDQFRFSSRTRPPSAILKIKRPGAKTVTCTFRQNNNVVGRITATINVGRGPYPPPYPPPPQGGQQYPPGGPTPGQAGGGPAQIIQAYFELIDIETNTLKLRADNTTPYGPHRINLTRRPNRVLFRAGLADPNLNINNYEFNWTITDQATGNVGRATGVQAGMPLINDGNAEFILEITDRNTHIVVSRIIAGLEFRLPQPQQPYQGGYPPQMGGQQYPPALGAGP